MNKIYIRGNTIFYCLLKHVYISLVRYSLKVLINSKEACSFSFSFLLFKRFSQIVNFYKRLASIAQAFIFKRLARTVNKRHCWQVYPAPLKIVIRLRCHALSSHVYTCSRCNYTTANDNNAIKIHLDYMHNC